MVMDHDHNTILIMKWSWSKLTDISTISTNLHNKKTGIVDMVMTKFGLSILTMKILEFWGWSQSNFD
jgi:hypothetical protein